MITKPRYWTRWRVLRTLNSMIEELEAEKNIKTQTTFLKTLFAKRRISSESFREWGVYYADDTEIVDAVHLLKNILESRTVESAMHRNLDTFIAMFSLKNNYGWREDPGASERDERRLDLQTDEVRNRLARVRRENLLDNGDTTHPNTT